MTVATLASSTSATFMIDNTTMALSIDTWLVVTVLTTTINSILERDLYVVVERVRHDGFGHGDLRSYQWMTVATRLAQARPSRSRTRWHCQSILGW